MSVTVMAVCWKYSKAKSTDLLVLLGLADIADDNGECWPSIAHLAKKCRIDERTTQRRIRSLEHLGEVVVVIGGGKASIRGGLRSNHYQILVHMPDEDEGGGSPPRQSATGGGETTQTPAERPPMMVAERPPESLIDTSLTHHSVVPASSTPIIRPRDELFDALVAVCGINPNELTSKSRGPLNGALRDLRSVGATPEDIRQRADSYRRRFTVPLTAQSLAKHWPTLDPRSAPADPLSRAVEMAREAGR